MGLFLPTQEWRMVIQSTMQISPRKGVHTFVRKTPKAKVMNFMQVNISVSVTRVALLGFLF